jgi:hypothetical protein
MTYSARQHLMAARLVRQNLLRRGRTPAEAGHRASTFVTLARMAAMREAEERQTRPARANGPRRRATHGASREQPVQPPEIFGTPGEFGAAQLLSKHRPAARWVSQELDPSYASPADVRVEIKCTVTKIEIKCTVTEISPDVRVEIKCTVTEIRTRRGRRGRLFERRIPCPNLRPIRSSRRPVWC